MVFCQRLLFSVANLDLKKNDLFLCKVLRGVKLWLCNIRSRHWRRTQCEESSQILTQFSILSANCKISLFLGAKMLGQWWIMINELSKVISFFLYISHFIHVYSRGKYYCNYHWHNNDELHVTGFFFNIL